MLKDRILAGSIAGMIATLIKSIPNLILWKLGIVKYLYFHLAASALIKPTSVHTTLGLIVGVVTDVITGGSLGIITVFLFKFTGHDYWWYKGLLVGNMVWLWGMGILINLGAARIVPVEPLFRLTSLLDHQLFGLIMAYLIIKLYPEPQPSKG